MSTSAHDFVADLTEQLRAAHDRLDTAGVDRYSNPVPWHVARTTTLTCRPWPSRPQPKESTNAPRRAC